MVEISIFCGEKVEKGSTLMTTNGTLSGRKGSLLVITTNVTLSGRQGGLL